MRLGNWTWKILIYAHLSTQSSFSWETTGPHFSWQVSTDHICQYCISLFLSLHLYFYPNAPFILSKSGSLHKDLGQRSPSFIVLHAMPCVSLKTIVRTRGKIQLQEKVRLLYDVCVHVCVREYKGGHKVSYICVWIQRSNTIKPLSDSTVSFNS